MFSLSNSTSSIQIPGYAESQRRKGKVLAAKIRPLRLNSTSIIDIKQEGKDDKDDEILEMARALQIEKDKVAKYQRDLLKAQGMLEEMGTTFRTVRESYKLSLERQQQTLHFLQQELLKARSSSLKLHSRDDMEAAKYLTLLGINSSTSTTASPNSIDFVTQPSQTSSNSNQDTPALTSSSSNSNSNQSFSPTTKDNIRNFPTFFQTTRLSTTSPAQVPNRVILPARNKSLGSPVSLISRKTSNGGVIVENDEGIKINRPGKRFRWSMSVSGGSPNFNIPKSPSKLLSGNNSADAKLNRIKTWINETEAGTRLYDEDPFSRD